VSRIPRFQEHLKTGFTAEAVSAARCRAYAGRAGSEGKPNLARRWLRLAAEKDRLAVQLLVAAEQVRGHDSNLGAAIAEERYENTVLYPKMIGDGGPEQVLELFRQIIAAQTEHLRQLENLRRELNAGPRDVHLPPEADQAPSRDPASDSPGSATGALHPPV
jgi:rubrerythrin